MPESWPLGVWKDFGKDSAEDEKKMKKFLTKGSAVFCSEMIQPLKNAGLLLYIVLLKCRSCRESRCPVSVAELQKLAVLCVELRWAQVATLGVSVVSDLALSSEGN